MTPLEINVMSRNAINELTIAQRNNLLPQLQKLVGKKLQKKDETKAAVLDGLKFIEPLACTIFDVNYRVQFSGTGLYLKTSMSTSSLDNRGRLHFYAESFLCRVERETGILAVKPDQDNVDAAKYLRTDYSVNEIQGLIDQKAELQSKLYHVDMELARFGKPN